MLSMAMGVVFHADDDKDDGGHNHKVARGGCYDKPLRAIVAHYDGDDDDGRQRQASTRIAVVRRCF